MFGLKDYRRFTIFGFGAVPDTSTETELQPQPLNPKTKLSCTLGITVMNSQFGRLVIHAGSGLGLGVEEFEA